MSLEVATYITQLSAANPAGGDKKNQGDDHLRLVKSVLQSTFPGASRAIRFTEMSVKSGNYNAVEADDQNCLVCDTTAGPFSITLPTPLTHTGWLTRVIKASADANPVYVLPPSGTINGLGLSRINVPFVEQTFFWIGSGFLRLKAADGAQAGVIEQYAGTAVPSGFALANGQSLVRAQCPELFSAWGTAYGAADGAHFNAPNLLDRFIVNAGLSYPLGATGGETTHVLSALEMPVHTHAVVQNPHDHGISGGTTGALQGGVDTPGGTSPLGIGAALDVTPANADITISNTGGGAAHENRPPYFGLYPIFRLC